MYENIGKSEVLNIFFFKVHHTYSNQLIFLFYFIFIGTELAVAVRNLAVLKNSYFNRH